MAKKETAFQKWYRKNRKAYNAKRRQRYSSDSEYREKMRAQARENMRKLRDEVGGRDGERKQER